MFVNVALPSKALALKAGVLGGKLEHTWTRNLQLWFILKISFHDDLVFHLAHEITSVFWHHFKKPVLTITYETAQ